MVKQERELRQLVRRVGLDLVNLTNTSGHYHLTIEAPNGAQRKLVVSGSSGDHRAAKNTEADLRRFLRENQAPSGAAPEPRVASVPPPPAAAPMPAAPAPQPVETPAMPKKGSSFTRNNLTDAEKFRFYEWLKTADLAGIYTKPALAERASQAMGMTITTGNAEGGLKVVGRELPIDPARRIKPATPNERVLARALLALMSSLGQQPDAELRALAE